MLSTIFSFSSLYFATLLMLIGTGLFNTYMGLTLTAKSVNEVWIGSMIAGYYLGLVCGARLGHKLIIRVGHIRAFVACAAVATSMILLQAQIDYLPIWLLLRLVSGIMMVTEFMVIESWLNEQTENRQRGRVFSVYMVVSGLGTVLGQLALTLYGALDDGPLILVAMCLVLCLVPIAVTARSHPPTPRPAPLDFFFFVKRVPLAMTVLFVAGNLSGAFYGLAPVYAAKHGLQTSQVALFVAVSVTAGLLSQWPIGWLSDRVNRAGLIRFNAAVLVLLPTLMWGWLDLPFWLLLCLSALLGVLQFTLYPLGAALANDHVEAERRVSLSAVLLMVYGVGACLGPLVAGILMSLGGHAMYYVFVPACALILVWRVRPSAVTGVHQVEEAPVQFVPMPDTLQSSPAMVALDPRVDPEVDPAMEMVTPEAGVVQPPPPAAEPAAGTAAFDNVVAEPGEPATVLSADGAPSPRTGTDA
ncbi:MFS transporter [Bordetella hinzii]|uniref:MFS transporter n=2 Tax=Bordetella hinzii TaxID=103855 RepID=A0AAN1RUL0_9BORD|nr:MFS transporter [Bordetella hinzii]AKQ54666.1 putative MFS-type transporter YcaD [Bordetella hinzii]AKQ59179.1 putative MFS-type transporter YcaD [Bordetella hinzii]AZW15562.1 MFS transporter [Bordetella hinzii]KCB23450.1 transporter, major facilitator family protein [Bordetella hinzii OH87 BAL007II]KCB26842.1 transporter, major facilitator family protein [Bordetella hinzii CA90 BAL1384]